MLRVQLLPGAISEMIASTSDTKMLTLADRYGLMAAIMSEFIREDELQAIDRLLRYIVRGRIQIVD